MEHDLPVAARRCSTADRYLLGREVVAFDQDGDGVSVTLADGSQARGGPAGLRRRGQLDRPGPADPAGRAVVRGLRRLARHAAGAGACRRPPARRFDDAIIYQVLDDSHILVYPIPGLDGSLAEGDRLINIVWYVNVAAGR